MIILGFDEDLRFKSFSSLNYVNGSVNCLQISIRLHFNCLKTLNDL